MFFKVVDGFLSTVPDKLINTAIPDFGVLVTVIPAHVNDNIVCLVSIGLSPTVI